MPLGRGIVEVFGAIPERIEVSGHGPTWRVTGGSFDSVLSYVRDALGDAVVVDREDRSRWWPRVTLTVTTDPDLAAEAPPVETFADVDPPGSEDQAQDEGPESGTPPEPAPSGWALEEIFAHQEQLRAERRRIPEQRSPRR